MSMFQEKVINLIPDFDGYSTLSYKWNIGESDVEEQIIDLIVYTQGYCCPKSKVFWTAGEHNEGKSEKPHIHLNMCVKNWVLSKNESRRRQGVLAHSNIEHGTELVFDDLECRISNKVDVEKLEKCLAYPYKEGKDIQIKVYQNHPRFYYLPDEMVQYLVCYAKGLFEASKKDRFKKERAAAKSGTLNGQIISIIKNKSFSDYHTYVKFVCEKFYEGLELEEQPDITFFHKALKQVAINQKIVSPYYFFV